MHFAHARTPQSVSGSPLPFALHAQPKVQLRTSAPSRHFRVRVVSAASIAKADRFGKSDPYVVLRLHDEKATKKPRKVARTKTINQTLNPVWDELLEFDAAEAEILCVI